MEFDVAIIGTGPAGLQAAIHAARKKVSVVVLGKVVNSAMTGTHVENYFGIPGVKDGDAILADGIAQAKEFGCTFVEYNVTSAEDLGGKFLITAEDDSTYEVVKYKIVGSAKNFKNWTVSDRIKLDKSIYKIDNWDNNASVPYVTENGRYYCGYDNPKSIAIKGDWIRGLGMKGMMYWDYNADDNQHTLCKAVWQATMK